MKRIDQAKKQQISGGIGPMMMWSAMIGVSMLIGSVANIVTTLVTSGNNPNNQTSQNQNLSRSSTRMRLSYRPSYSGLYTDMFM